MWPILIVLGLAGVGFMLGRDKRIAGQTLTSEQYVLLAHVRDEVARMMRDIVERTGNHPYYDVFEISEAGEVRALGPYPTVESAMKVVREVMGRNARLAMDRSKWVQENPS